VAEIAAEIEQITQSIWGSLFELPLSADGSGFVSSEPAVTACVLIVGAWHGAVMLQCPLSLASTLADQMFQSGSEPTLDEVRDALGELTNMLGGNLKAVLPGPSQISLPTVAVGSDYDVGVPDAKVVTRVPFVCDGEPLLVTLFEAEVKSDKPQP
jgi:chemotaxis protein CheX